MVEPKFKEIVKTKIAYKLGTLLSKDKYEIDPTAENSLRHPYPIQFVSASLHLPYNLTFF
jgi:hypothetical protein